MSHATDEFLQTEALTLSVTAAFGRAHIYAPEATESERADVRSHLKRLLKEIGKAYDTRIDEETQALPPIEWVG